ncbi:MAG: hypothetical protein WDO14_13245 [Bacteroidota bacterium]
MERATAHYNRIQIDKLSNYDKIIARGGDGIRPVFIEFEIALLFTTAGIGNVAEESTHTIYRVVSKEEAADVLVNGFRQAPISSKISSYEGKLFWSNIDDAKWFKSWKGADDVILKVKVNDSFIYENGYDAGRLFYYVNPERMSTFNSATKVIR